MLEPRSQPGPLAGTVFGLLLLFATGGFAFFLLFQAVRLNGDPPATPRAPRAEELAPSAPPLLAAPAGPAPAPHPHPPRAVSPLAPDEAGGAGAD
jgi:hypothetical protein